MADERLEFKFKCPFCGGTELELPVGYTDDSMATCGSCGSDIAPWSDIKAQAAALQPAREPTKFKGMTGSGSNVSKK